MHVAQINFFSDPQRRAPEQLLQAWWALGDIADAPAAAGVKVSVVQASSFNHTYIRSGISYYFSQSAANITDRSERVALGQLLDSLAADVLHVHGLGFSRQTVALAELCPRVPILLQDHADRVPRIWRRAGWRRGIEAAAGLVFCNAQQALPFKRHNLIWRDLPVYAIPESTSRFTIGDQAAARSLTGLYGDPCVLWVGHLNANKDPLTVLEGISRAAQEFPQLQLWCCYGTAPLMGAVNDRIRRDPMLTDRVHLLGTVSHERIQQLMHAADIFVSGSHREGSGFSLIEALACGLVPVVTDIPSFRSLTGDGAIGRLWQSGDAIQFAAALQVMAVTVTKDLRVSIRNHFDRHLSLAAVGRQFANAYRRMVEHHQVRST